MNKYEKTEISRHSESFAIGYARMVYQTGSGVHLVELCLGPHGQMLSWPSFPGPVTTGGVELIPALDWILPFHRPVKEFSSDAVLGYLLASENCDLEFIELLRRNIRGYCEAAKIIPSLEKNQPSVPGSQP